MDFQWRVCDNQCGSGHSPIFLGINKPMLEEWNLKWHFHKANWPTFNDYCSSQINKEIPNEPDPITSFSRIVTQIVKQTIPKSSIKIHTKSKTWFTAECREAVKTRKK